MHGLSMGIEERKMHIMEYSAVGFLYSALDYTAIQYTPENDCLNLPALSSTSQLLMLKLHLSA